MKKGLGLGEEEEFFDIACRVTVHLLNVFWANLFQKTPKEKSMK